MTPPRSHKMRFIYIALFILAFVICTPFIVLYSLGYDFGEDFSLFKTGGVFVYSGDSGMNIYLDGELREKTTPFSHSVLIKGLDSGTHNVRVSKPGYTEWSKTVEVYDQIVSELYPYALRLNATAKDIVQFEDQVSKDIKPVETDQYKNAKNSFGISLSTTTTKSKIKITKEGNSIIASWLGNQAEIPFFFCKERGTICEDEFLVVKTTDLGDMSFYPGRNDVIFYVDGKKLFVTELDKRPPQNTVMLYQGKLDIDFRISDDDSVIIKEGKEYKRIEI